MQHKRMILTSLALLVVTGCAYQSDVESIRRDTDEMKSRIYALDKGLGEVRGEVKQGVDRSLAGYRQSLESLQKDMAGYQKEMAAIRKGGADLQATLDSARVDMQLLTGKVDDVRLLAQKPAEEVDLLKQDLAKRFEALEERLARLEKGLDEQQKRAAQLQQTPDYQYQQAYDTMQSGKPAQAREQFAKFLEKYPKHSLSANAHYWLGETYYSEKNFEQAILEFQDVIKNFPDSGKVPAAMLKQAMAFGELKDPKSATYVYRKLVEEFPKSEEAKVAQERLKAK